MTPLIEAELAAIEARANAATERPWKHWEDCKWDDPVSCGYDSRAHHRGPPYYCTGPRCASEAAANIDARFVSHARTDVPRLLETVRYWRTRVELTPEGASALVEASSKIADLEAQVARVREALRIYSDPGQNASAAYDNGRADERTAIVAWMRGMMPMYKPPYSENVTSLMAGFAETTVVMISGRIQRGEHLEGDK